MGVGDKVRDIIVDALGVDAADVTLSADLVDDLGADSLRLVELRMGLEEEFGIEILDEDAEGIMTVRQVVEFVIATAGKVTPAPPVDDAGEDAPTDTAEAPVAPAAADAPAAAGAPAEDDDDDVVYAVVINHEEQYSIWPADREPPMGWARVGKEGTKAECLAHINVVWTDMRPLSLRHPM